VSKGLGMRSRRLAALAGLVALTLAACGGGHKKATGAAATVSTTSTSTAATAGTGEVTSVAPSPTTTAASPSKTTATSAKSGASGSSQAASAPATPGAPQPIPPGKYTYNQKGEFKVGVNSQATPAQGTLTLDPPASDGHQVAHRATDPSQPSSDTTFLFKSDGMFLESTRQGSGSTTFSCTFNPPIPTPPWPPAVGKSLSGHANCDPGFTTDVSGKITDTKQVPLDGKTYTVYVVETTVDTHGSLESHTTQVNWFSPDLRLSTHDESHTTGSYQGFSFTSDQADDLVSGKPA
jgi:hypothetical protein